MITLTIAYDDNSESLIKDLQKLIAHKYPFITLKSFHENLFKERKKAFKLKGGFSARKNPFAVLKDSDNKIIKVYYTENNDCTESNILDTLNSLIPYKH